MDEELILEQEGDMPDGWETNTILIRDENNNIIEYISKDDEEKDIEEEK